MRIRGIVASVLFLVPMTGCVVTPARPISPEFRQTDFPKKGETISREIGDSIVEQSKLYLLNSLEFFSDSTYRNGFRLVKIAAKSSLVEALSPDGQHMYCGKSLQDTTIVQQGVFSNWISCIKISGTAFFQWDSRGFSRIDASNLNYK